MSKAKPVRPDREKSAVSERLKEIPVIFYRTGSGGEIVLEWLRSLSPDDRRVIGADLDLIQVGWPIGMPLCRALGDGLWEVRSSLSGGRIARLLFFIEADRIGVVHGFMKKTNKTPPGELDLARRRMTEMKG